ncbi:putative HTH-type transcriptional regulator YurK [Burkholderiales bacterium]|nr:MAG: GntR family transcriptional regulator [Burkholderiales bacterium]CAG0995342.1 putative HTH-type transcriptional regulator YurK [Burkholderiales bacterium]
MKAMKPGAVSSPSPSFQPLYQQIKELLTQGLQNGEWQPGETIPSEIDLAARYQVSQGTVRKAIDELAAENILVRRQGKGTFVATHTEEAASVFRFLRIRRCDGREEAPESRLLEVRRGKATAEVARALQMKPGEAVVVLSRVLDYSGEPIIYDEITLPGVLFKGLTKAKCEAYKGSMYSFFETQFGVRMIRAEERLRAIGAEPEVARELRVAPGTPLLSVDRIAYTYGDRPVELRRGLCTTRHHCYINQLG